MKCFGNKLSRRSMLTVGAAGGLGLTLPQLLQVEEARAELKHYENLPVKAKSVIHVFLPGGIMEGARRIRYAFSRRASGKEKAGKFQPAE